MSAHLNKSDTSLWLHNKLGNANDLWSNGSICSQLNADVLKNIRDCFTDLQSLVKLKLLLSFLHIPKKNVELWKAELEEIIEVASIDSDQWVSMVAELLKSFPETGSINFNVEENATVFTDLITELKKSVRKHSDTGILPIESLYLNKNAFTAQIGAQPQPVKHFTLRRKPKSAALRAELLQKSIDVASNTRKGLTIPAAPARYRGLTKELNDNTPLKGIPSRNSFGSALSSFKTPNPANRSAGSVRNPTRPTMPGVRRDGGIKLLDIGEQPLGRDAKRKKRNQEETETKQKENDKTNGQDSTATPDYALGLTSLVPPSPAPAYSVPQTPGPYISDPVQPKKEPASTIKSPPNATLIKVKSPDDDANQATTTPTSSPTNSTASPLPSGSINKTTIVTTASASKPILPNPPQLTQITIIPKQQTITLSQQPNPMENHTQTTTQQISYNPIQQQQLQSQATQPSVIQQTPQQTVQPAPQQATTRLQLSSKQIMEAQELFKNSNTVGKVEKALILSFMGGSRENPCPHLGDIVTIKLSEKEEQLRQPDGTIINVIAENHYQMNYSTGEAKQIKKLRRVA